MTASQRMTASQPPPGGPFNPEFRDAIDQLAKQAREEDLLAESNARRKRLAKRPFTNFVISGLVLIVLQGVLFLYLYTRKEQAPKKVVVTKPLHPENTCNAIMYRTYWKVVAYAKDQGHPPESFDQMLGQYLDKLPTDPDSGNPLLYSTDGKRFEINCPGVAAKR